MTTYDLSQPIRDDMPVYPGDPPVTCRPLATVSDDGYRVTGLEMDSHAGTHVDAPAHMIADGPTIDDFDPETFRFDARVIDLSSLEPRATIRLDRLPEGVETTPTDSVDLLVLRTGWDRHWGSDRYFDHPYLTARVAERIVEWGCHVGIDAPNVDPTPTENASADEPDGYPAHRTLFDDGRLIVENLRGLDRLPAGEPIEIHAYPLPIANADGAPVRALGVV